jgi:Ca2+-binding EF-hand superfamily protein
MTNLTPAQLEQFESTFRYFDKDESNILSQPEMMAALASLGIVYSVRSNATTTERDCTELSFRVQDYDMDYIYDQLLQRYGAVTFEAFINLLVCVQSSIVFVAVDKSTS